MTRETKVGLLVGTGIILLIGIVVSDHLAAHAPAQDGAAGPTMAEIGSGGVHPQGLPPEATAAGEPQPAQFGANGANLPGTGRDAEPLIPRGRLDGSANNAAGFRRGDGPSNEDNAPQPPRDANPGGADVADDGDTIDEPARRLVEMLNRRGVESEVVTRDGEGNDTQTNRDANQPQPIYHTVGAGETMWAIAAKYYNDGEAWPKIAAANPGKVSRDGTVQEGAKLAIPHEDVSPRGGRDAAQDGTTRDGRNGRDARSTTATIVVQPGDSLSELASKHLGSAGRWHEFVKANRDQLDDSGRIRAGMKLRLPATTTQAAPQREVVNRSTTRDERSARDERTDNSGSGSRSQPNGRSYTVQPGENLTMIARRTLGSGTKWKVLYEMNKSRIPDPDNVRAGVVLALPTEGR